MPTDLTQLPGRIKRLRESAGYSQLDFAKMCGLTQAQISAYELGKSFPGLESTVSLANALGTTVTALLEESDPKTAPPRPPSKHEMAYWILEAIGIEGFPLERCRAVLIDKVYTK